MNRVLATDAAVSLPVRGVLFDLDGTLLDTAPDLGYAANCVREEAGLKPLPLLDYRVYASGGARSLLGRALGVTPESPGYADLKDRFLLHYRHHLSRASRPFDGMEPLLQRIEREGGAWGVVTNKVRALAAPLMANLGLDQRSACMVCGDDVSQPKPAPDSLLHAAALLQLDVSQLIYVGDDRRDIDAARAAGMRSVAAAWGYLGDTGPVSSWEADVIVHSADALNAMLQIEVCTE